MGRKNQQDSYKGAENGFVVIPGKRPVGIDANKATEWSVDMDRSNRFIANKKADNCTFTAEDWKKLGDELDVLYS